VHHFVEKQLVVRIGELGDKLHSGRSRTNKSLPICDSMCARPIDELRKSLAEVCGRSRSRRSSGSAAMPAYTHLQHAEPVLVAHWLLAYVEMFFAGSERLPFAVSG